MSSNYDYRKEKHDPKVVAVLCKALISTSNPRTRRPWCGICAHVLRVAVLRQDIGHYSALRSILSSIMRGWPERRDDDSYPVGGESEFWDEVRAGTMWTNTRRLALLTYCLEEASKLKVK